MPGPIERQDYPDTDADIPDFLAAMEIPGIFDIHVHAMPERLQQAVWRFFDRLDDPAWPIAYRRPLEVRSRTLRELGVVAHTALAYAHKPGMAASLNAFTLGLADPSATPRIVPTFTVYPDDDAAEEVARCLQAGGRVAKVHLQVGRFHTTDPRLDDVWLQLESARTPIVLHAGAVYGVDGGEEFCGIRKVGELLDRHPDLVVVLAHLGRPEFEDALTLAEQMPSLFLDTAMTLADPPYLVPFPEPLLSRLADRRDQLLFGSDFPTIPTPYVAQIRGLAALELDKAGLRAVLHDRADGLLSG